VIILCVSFCGMKSAGIVAVILLGLACGFGAQNASPSPTPNVYQRFSHPSKLRVSSEVMAGLMIHRVDPVYPPEAKKKHVKGNVLLQVLINKQGHVADAVVVKGDPTLAGATVEAVKQWRFQPYLLNGEPVDVETVEVLSFGK
jgi:protein TonB